MTLREVVAAAERAYLIDVLARASSMLAAAEEAGIDPSTLWRRCRKYGLTPRVLTTRERARTLRENPAHDDLDPTLFR